MPKTRNYYRHGVSGEVYLLEFDSQGITACLGPLHHSDLGDPYAHDPGDPEDADWAQGEPWRALDWPGPEGPHA